LGYPQDGPEAGPKGDGFGHWRGYVVLAEGPRGWRDDPVEEEIVSRADLGAAQVGEGTRRVESRSSKGDKVPRRLSSLKLMLMDSSKRLGTR